MFIVITVPRESFDGNAFSAQIFEVLAGTPPGVQFTRRCTYRNLIILIVRMLK